MRRTPWPPSRTSATRQPPLKRWRIRIERSPKRPARRRRTLLSAWSGRHTDTEVLAQKDSISVRPEIWRSVFSVASDHFHVDICDLLNLDEDCEDWEDYEYTENGIQIVIDSACKDAKISDQEFWRQVTKYVRRAFKEAVKNRELRGWALERVLLSTSLPRLRTTVA